MFKRIFNLLAIGLVGLILPLASIGIAKADTAPPTGTPATVSADPLPTVQVDGIVWDEAISGNTVYATGHFNYARPAGSAPGTNQVVRTNLLAFDITTGKLITSFNHSLTDTNSGNTKNPTAGKAISVSPDGRRLYVGGQFQKVDGKYHSNFAAFDLTQPGGPVIATNFVGPVSGSVSAIAATNNGVFIGGSFSSISNNSRTNLAAYTAGGLLNTNWKPAVTLSNGQAANVLSILPLPDKVLIGGSYDTLNGSTYYGSGAVNRTYGTNLPWASQSSSYPIRYSTKDGGVTSLTVAADGKQVYLSGKVFSTNGVLGGTFEGRAAISPTNGSIIWANNCYGDTYDALPIGSVLYSVGHAHDCSAINAFPEARPTSTAQHVLAETTAASGSYNQPPTTNHGFDYFDNLPDSTQLDWYPFLNEGTVSGQSQAAWAITGGNRLVNNQTVTFIALGGEFTKAGNVNQQGLVRYATTNFSPHKIGPNPYTGAALTYGAADNSGQIIINARETYDVDNAVLSYKIYRLGATKVQICGPYQFDTRFWTVANYSFGCIDSGLTPGSAPQYQLVVTDPNGNALTTK